MRSWWRGHGYFTRYMLREGTSVFLAAYALALLAGLVCLANGEEYYEEWLAVMRNPVSVLVHLAVLAAALFHTVTWFEVSPKAMPPLRIGREPVPPRLIIAGQYLLSVLASVVVLAIAWRG